jgi:DNA-binding Lrp family transcriptional regulator
VETLAHLPKVEALYEVTGESDIIMLVSAESIADFRDFLKNKIMKTPGVRSTVTSIVLSTAKDIRTGRQPDDR